MIINKFEIIKNLFPDFKDEWIPLMKSELHIKFELADLHEDYEWLNDNFHLHKEFFKFHMENTIFEWTFVKKWLADNVITH